MKKKGTKNLTYTQRLQLEAYTKARLHKSEIALKLGVCLATVYNELKRGEYLRKENEYNGYWCETRTKIKKAYSPIIAYEKYRFNQTSKCAPLKIANDYEFVSYVERRILFDKYSPSAVLGEINRNNLFKTRISKTTIYRYISSGIFLNITMDKLPIGQRKKRYRKLIKKPPRGVSIEKRPAEVAERKTFGHWEMDCVCGSTKHSLLVLTERMTRKEIIFPLDNQKADSVISALNKLERRYGKMFRRLFKSITVDNGAEFSNVSGLEKSIFGGKRVDVYYCHPYCSSERGSNERLNREIRRHIPKGSNLSRYSHDDIKAVKTWINNYPRGIFNYATSEELFTAELAKLE